MLKAAREKQQITHKGIPIRITADLSIETLEARREWQDILKVMKDNNLQPRILYPARISFKYEGEIKSFCLSVKLLISPSYLNEILAGYSNLGCRFFSLITLSMSCHSLLACRVATERSAVCMLFVFPLLLLIFVLCV